MPVKWTKPKKAEKRAEARRPDTPKAAEAKGKGKKEAK